MYIVDADVWININIVQYLEEQADYPIWNVNEAYIVNFKQKNLYDTLCYIAALWQ